jgi:hypothetical protein
VGAAADRARDDHVDHARRGQQHGDARAVVALAGERDRDLPGALRAPGSEDAELHGVAGVVDVDLPAHVDRAGVVDRDPGVLPRPHRERLRLGGGRHREEQQPDEQETPHGGNATAFRRALRLPARPPAPPSPRCGR